LKHDRHGRDDNDDHRGRRRTPTAVVIAALSLLVSALSFGVAGWALRDTHHVGLSVHAAQAYDGARLFTPGTVLEVTILNPSLRTTNLVGAEVRFGGRRLADVQYAVPDVNALSATARRDLVGASLRLPVSVGPGQAVIAALVTTNRDAHVAERLAKAANPAFEAVGGRSVAAFSWCHTVTYHDGKRVGPGLPPPRRFKSAGELKVVMKFEPGGRKTVTMGVTPSLAGGTYGRAENPDVAPGWHVKLDVDAKRVQGLVLFKPMHDPPENARIKLWRGRERQPEQTKFERLTDETACIDFGALDADRYRWSAAVGGHKVAAGNFRTSCTPTSDRPRQRQSVDPEVCQ
jgi:hypothetical protein